VWRIRYPVIATASHWWQPADELRTPCDQSAGVLFCVRLVEPDFDVGAFIFTAVRGARSRFSSAEQRAALASRHIA